MTSKPLPPHGSSARAHGSPGYRARCTCGPCKATLNKLQKRALYNRQIGRSPFVSPDRAIAHLDTLSGLMAWRDIASATRIAESNLFAIIDGTRTKIRVSTERRILAVPVPAAASPTKLVHPIGTIRRIQGLSRMGYSLRVIAQHAGTYKDVLRSVLNGERTGITQPFAARISETYNLLSQEEPPVNRHTTRARNFAAAHGWHLPTAWDEESIDDPDAQPITEMNARELAAYRREEIVHLDSCGTPEVEIAARLGLSAKYVQNQLRQLRELRTAA